MKKKTLELLLNYDIHKMAVWKDDTSLSREMRLFLNINGLVLLQRVGDAKSLYDRNKKFLQEIGLAQFLDLLIHCDQNKEIEPLLFNILDQGVSLGDLDYLRGEYYFTIGYCLMQIKDFSLAIQFLKKSIVDFRKDELLSFQWRSEYCVYLCQRNQGQFTGILEGEKNLYDQYFLLPLKAQIYFSRFLVWQTMGEYNYVEAKKIVETNLKKVSVDLDRDLYSFLRKNWFYFEIKERGFSAIEGLDLLNSERDFVESIKWINSVTVKTTVPHTLKVINHFFTKHGTNDRVLLYDLLCEKLFIIEDYEKLIKLYKVMERNVIDNLMTICDYRDYVLIAYKKKKMSRKFNETYEKYKITSHPRRFSKVQRILTDIDRQQKKALIEVDKKMKQIRVKGKLYFFNRRKKMFDLLCYILSQKKCDINSMSIYLYGADMSRNRHKSMSLLNRCQKIFEKEKIIVSENYFWKVSPFYYIKFVNGTEKSGRLRKIVRYLSEKDVSGIKDIEKNFPFISRRSLQMDLKVLCEERRIETIGKGRALKYRACQPQ